MKRILSLGIFFLNLLFWVFGLNLLGREGKLTDLEAAKLASLKSIVKILIKVPIRGRSYINNFESGIVIDRSRLIIEREVNKKKEIEEIFVYQILTCPHGIGSQGVLLKYWQEEGIKIFVEGPEEDIDGKKQVRFEASLLAWNWDVESMLLELRIPKALDSEITLIPVKIGDKLPISLSQSLKEGVDFSEVWVTGFPASGFSGNIDRILTVCQGMVAKYEINKQVNPRFFVAKTMNISLFGLSGPGVSGGGIFMMNKDKKPVLVGMVGFAPSYAGGNFVVGIPIDVIVEGFLKAIPGLSLELPNFKISDKFLKNKTFFPSQGIK